MVKAKFLPEITFILWKRLRYSVSFFFVRFPSCQLLRVTQISPKGQTSARMYCQLTSDRLCLPQKDQLLHIRMHTQTLTVSRNADLIKEGLTLSLSIWVKTSLFCLWSCTCPCFCRCSEFTCSFFYRKFIDQNIILMLKSNTLTDVLESEEECTIFQNYCAYLLILSFARHTFR